MTLNSSFYDSTIKTCTFLFMSTTFDSTTAETVVIKITAQSIVSPRKFTRTISQRVNTRRANK